MSHKRYDILKHWNCSVHPVGHGKREYETL